MVINKTAITIISILLAAVIPKSAALIPRYLRTNQSYYAIPPSSFGIFHSLWDIFNVLKDIICGTVAVGESVFVTGRSGERAVRVRDIFTGSKNTLNPLGIMAERKHYNINPEIMNLPPVFELYTKMRQNRVVELPAGGRKPFIVIEGVKGSGKSALTVRLATALNASYLRAPPEYFTPFKPWMKTRNKLERNAFHSLSNYLMAEQVKKLLSSQTVVMDLYWHGLTAYELGRLSGKTGVLPLPSSPVFRWPEDLLVPDISFYIMVTEERRYYRERETMLPAVSKRLREAMFRAFSRFHRPRMVHINGDRTRREIESDIRNNTYRMLQGML